MRLHLEKSAADHATTAAPLLQTLASSSWEMALRAEVWHKSPRMALGLENRTHFRFPIPLAPAGGEKY